MSYLSADARSQILANPAAIETFYMQLWRQFAADLGPVDPGLMLGASILPVAFAAVVAWDLKPYGAEPAGTDLATLLAAPSLACDDYVRLAWYLTREMPQVQWAPARIAAVGWKGGAVGNHAQMLVGDGANTLLLDPTVGLVARIGYDSLVSGRPPAAMQSFWPYNADRPIGSFQQAVQAALLGGKYRPSDALYFVAELAQYTSSMPPSTQWLTPAIAPFQLR